MEVCKMLEQPRAAATTSDTVDEPLPEAPTAARSIDVPTTEVLITEEEAVFGTAAAVAPRRQGAGHRLLARLWGVWAGWTNASHRHPYSLPYYLEHARLSREIDRV
jgi:hypothetical protein